MLTSQKSNCDVAASKEFQQKRVQSQSRLEPHNQTNVNTQMQMRTSFVKIWEKSKKEANPQNNCFSG